MERRGSRAYFGALMVAQVSALVRYAVLARLLGPEQLGLAAIIVLTGQFFDSLTDSGGDRFLIQDRDGAGTAAFRLIELIAVVRAAVMALLILLLASPIAALAGAPQITAGLRAFAIVPLINGFMNYDFRAAQRDHQFAPESKVLALSEIAGLVGTIVAAAALRDFTAAIYGLATRATVAVLVSHLVSNRSYAVGYAPELARRLLRFGAPLMLNGVLLFAATQSDRIIVSRYLGVAELGRYSVLLLPIYYPTAMLMRYLSVLYLPQVSGASADAGTLSRVSHGLSALTFSTAGLVMAAFAWLAPPALPFLFSRGFAQDATVIVLVGIVTALRLIKVAPTTIAIGIGATEIAPINNVLRLAGLPLALLGLVTLGGLEGILLGLIAGEIIANVSATALLNRRAGWKLTRDMGRYALFGLLSFTLFARGNAIDHHLTERMLLWSIAGLLICAFYGRAGVTFLKNRRTFSRVLRWGAS